MHRFRWNSESLLNPAQEYNWKTWRCTIYVPTKPYHSLSLSVSHSLAVCAVHLQNVQYTYSQQRISLAVVAAAAAWVYVQRVACRHEKFHCSSSSYGCIACGHFGPGRAAVGQELWIANCNFVDSSVQFRYEHIRASHALNNVSECHVFGTLDSGNLWTEQLTLSLTISISTCILDFVARMHLIYRTDLCRDRIFTW